MIRILPLFGIIFLFTSCAGTNSTIKQGYAYRMTEDQAAVLVDSVIRSNIASDRMLPRSKLVASGYDRFVLDTHTYTATAIAAPRQSAYGFEVRHTGTMFDGPIKAKRIYKTLNERAELIGPKTYLKD
jgi:hypothetical protein